MSDDSAGQFVDAALLAGAVSQDAAAGHATATNCANCGAVLGGRYCSACGQRGDIHRSLLHLGEEFFHGLLHFDGKFWHTLPLLLFKPGALTRRYVMGERVRFVTPVALFLFSIFLMFFTVSNLDPAAALRSKGPEAIRGDDFPGALDKEGLFDWKGSVRKLADQDLNIMNSPDITAKAKESLRDPDLLLYKIKNVASEFSFLLVPLSLPFLWVIFVWKRGVRLYDHVIFSLHSLSFMALFVALWSGLALAHLARPLGQWPMWIMPAHMFFHVKGAYRLGIWGALWRTSFLGILAVIVLTIYVVGILVLSAVH